MRFGLRVRLYEWVRREGREGLSKTCSAHAANATFCATAGGAALPQAAPALLQQLFSLLQQLFS